MKPAATRHNMPATRYGVVPVRTTRVIDDSAPELRVMDQTVWYTAIDLLAQGMDPRPMFSTRQRMGKMRPARLGLFIIAWSVYFSLPPRVSRWWIVRHIWGWFL